MLAKLVTRSDRIRFQHTVVSLLAVGPIGEKIKAAGIPVYSLGMRRGVPSAAGLWRLLVLLRQAAPAVVQTWLYHADLLGLLGGLIARAPVIWNIRSSYHHGLHSPVTKVCAWLSRLPAVVVVNSEAGREIHAGVGYRPREWQWIPNGFDLDAFVPDQPARASVRQELGLPGDALLIGMIARYDPQKDFSTFARAAGLLLREGPAATFLLAGDGITAENGTLSQLLDADGVAGMVRLLGRRHDVPRLMAALDVATLSSSYGEGFPNVVGEAMACGVPCVVTDVGASATIVGDTGRVVPPRDPAALAAAWGELLTLPSEERSALGERARARVEANFGLDHIVREYEDLYERVARVSKPKAERCAE